MKKIFSKENLTRAVAAVLAFILCIGLFLTAISASLMIAARKDFATYSAKNSNYTRLAVDEMREKLNNLAIPSGLPENFFDSRIDYARFDKTFFAAFAKVIDRKTDYSIDVTGFAKEISTDVTDYSIENLGELSSDAVEAIDAFATECATIYLTYVNPSLVNYVYSLLGTVFKYAAFANIGSIILSFVAGFLLSRLGNSGTLKKYYFASGVGAALTCGVIPALLLITGEVSRLAIISPSLHALLTGFATDVLWVMVVASGILLLTSTVLLVFQIKGLIFRR